MDDRRRERPRAAGRLFSRLTSAVRTFGTRRQSGAHRGTVGHCPGSDGQSDAKANRQPDANPYAYA